MNVSKLVTNNLITILSFLWLHSEFAQQHDKVAKIMFSLTSQNKHNDHRTFQIQHFCTNLCGVQIRA